jgi:hypothetical protein
VLEPKNIPGMYCITGTTLCTDFDIKKPCNCSNCDFFKENKLKNSNSHFCRTK